MNIFFVNAGRRTYMVEFALALTDDVAPVGVLVGDPSDAAPTKHVSPRVVAVTIPRVDDDPAGFAAAVLDHAVRLDAGIVIPLSDRELAPLAAAKPAFAAEGIRLVVADPVVVERTMNKRNAYAYCLETGIPTPHSIFAAGELPARFPCLVKPIEGSASQGVRIVEDAAGLAGFRAGEEVIQALIVGDEYGIDILNDFDGNFLKATVKRKLLMRAGETDRASVVVSPMLEALGRRIGETFRHVGNLDVDVLVDRDDQPFCIDFNARFGGGYPFTHLAGMNYLTALVDLARGRAPQLPAAPTPITAVKGISLHVVGSAA